MKYAADALDNITENCQSLGPVTIEIHTHFTPSVEYSFRVLEGSLVLDQGEGYTSLHDVLDAVDDCLRNEVDCEF